MKTNRKAILIAGSTAAIAVIFAGVWWKFSLLMALKYSSASVLTLKLSTDAWRERADQAKKSAHYLAILGSILTLCFLIGDDIQKAADKRQGARREKDLQDRIDQRFGTSFDSLTRQLALDTNQSAKAVAVAQLNAHHSEYQKINETTIDIFALRGERTNREVLQQIAGQQQAQLHSETTKQQNREMADQAKQFFEPTLYSFKDMLGKVARQVGDEATWINHGIPASFDTNVISVATLSITTNNWSFEASVLKMRQRGVLGTKLQIVAKNSGCVFVQEFDDLPRGGPRFRSPSTVLAVVNLPERQRASWKTAPGTNYSAAVEATLKSFIQEHDKRQPLTNTSNLK